MSVLRCYVDEETLKLLELASAETGRKVEELAEAAIQNEAIAFKVSRGYVTPAKSEDGHG